MLSMLLSLRLSACNLTDSVVVSLTDLLASGILRDLRALALDANSLALQACAGSFGEALGSCASALIELDLSHNPIDDTSGAHFVEMLLGRSSSLCTLHLGETLVGDDTACASAEAMRTNSSSQLAALCLSGAHDSHGACVV